MEDFLRKVEFDHVFSHHSTVPSDVYMELGKARGKQIFVHQIWRTVYATTLSQFQFNVMILEISYINQQGNVESEKVSVTGKSIHSLLCARNGATKLSFLYDGINVKRSESRNEQSDNGTSQQHTISQSHNLNDSRIDLIQNNVMHFLQIILFKTIICYNQTQINFPRYDFFSHGCITIMMVLTINNDNYKSNTYKRK